MTSGYEGVQPFPGAGTRAVRARPATMPLRYAHAEYAPSGGGLAHQVEPTEAIRPGAMLRLSALGGATLRRGGVRLGGASAQGRRLALLTILASGGDLGVSRDALLGLLWPESTEGRARHALSQWLFLVRRDLGFDDIIVGSTVLHLNRERITTDVSDFDAAIRAKAWHDAAMAYRGTLLEGLLLSNAPEFQEWLDRERDRRHEQAKQAMAHLARAAEARGEPQEALVWWQRTAALDPHSGPTAARVIELLAASGDDIAALAFARRHERALRTTLVVSPSAAVASMITTLTNRLQVRAVEQRTAGHRAADDPYLQFMRDRLASRYIVNRVVNRSSLTTGFTARVTADLRPTMLWVLLPDLLVRADCPRLLALLEAAAQVRHPNIESPDDLAALDGMIFFAVAGEHGPTLHDRRSQPLPPLSAAETLGIGTDLSAALAHAHRHGVVHGNLTPRRVVLRRGGARITELGVLPALRATTVLSPDDSGCPTGTPAYLSPDQLTGDEAAVPADDIYSLGCILYEMLTGQPPHTATNGRTDIAARLREPAAALAETDSSRPDGLDALIAAMLERTPESRPSAATVERELRRMSHT